jgi:hypothetical protein
MRDEVPCQLAVAQLKWSFLPGCSDAQAVYLTNVYLSDGNGA